MKKAHNMHTSVRHWSL